MMTTKVDSNSSTTTEASTPPMTTTTASQPVVAALKVARTAVADVKELVKLWNVQSDPSSCIIILGAKSELTAIEFGIKYMYERPIVDDKRQQALLEKKLDKLEVKRLHIHWKNVNIPAEDEIGKTFTTSALFVLPLRKHFPKTHAILDDLGLIDNHRVLAR